MPDSALLAANGAHRQQRDPHLEGVGFISPDDSTLSLESVAVIRALEATTKVRLSGMVDAPASEPILMLRAAQAVSAYLLHRHGDEPADMRVDVYAGPGNNGGDALLAAVNLHTLGVDVRVCMPAAPTAHDARWALNRATDAGVIISASYPLERRPDDAHTVADEHARHWLIDGLFGIGLNRPLTGVFAEIATALSNHTASGGHVLSLDIPSGLDAETGNIVGGNHGGGNVAVVASHTLTFLTGKAGLFTGHGRDLCGTIFLAPLGTTQAHVDAARRTLGITPPMDDTADVIPLTTPLRQGAWLNAPARFISHFPRRRPSSHKGTFGSVAIIGGETGTCGAVILAARAALYCGAGRVHTGLVGEGGPAYDPPHPEIMMRRVDAIELDTMDALAIGPGLGRQPRGREALVNALLLNLPTLLDADALNLIAADEDIAEAVRANGHIVMTPHPGEAARLLSVDTAAIGANRIAAAVQLATKFACTVVLKGSGTIITNAEGRLTINATGNAGLATGGTGDVLSGVIGAFLAQGLPPYEAALAGTFVHGRAAERCRDAGTGPVGLTAGELAPHMRDELNELYARHRLI